MKKVITILSVAMLFFSMCTMTEASAGQRERVSAIRIQGNRAVSTATILNKLRLQPGDTFDESALNQEIRRLYATGFFGDVFVETDRTPEGVEVVFTVVERPVIRDVELRGEFSTARRHLMRQIKVEKGTLLDFHILSQDVSALTQYLRGQGYSRARVDHEVETDPDTGEVTVAYIINEGRTVFVRSIDFEGNENIPDGDLSRAMSTRTRWWFIRKGTFDEAQFRADLNRIRTLYRSRGFLDATVESDIDYSDDGSEMFITVKVTEGQQYLIGEITLSGPLAFPEREIRDQIEISSGDPFDNSMIREDIDRVYRFYYDKGYIDADINLSHRYNADTDRMDINYEIDPRNVVYVGRVNVIGNTKTQDKVVRREIRLYPGERYDGEKLRRSKQRIYDLGFFEDVFIDTVSTDTADVKDLNVTVKETKTGEFSFGGGYSSVDAFLGFVQVRQRNFDITNFPTFTGGGQDLVIRGEIGSARTNYRLSWTDPWIFDYPYLFGFDVYRSEHDKFSDSGYDYDETRTGGALRLGKEITDELSTSLRYNLEEVKIGSVSDNASQALKDEQGKNTLSRLEWSVAWDTRDNRFSPKDGWLTGFSLENAGGFMGGDKNFVKGYVHGSYYHGIIDRVILELRGRVGMVESYGSSDTVPVYERFFAGGATTIRGYDQRAVGPRDSEERHIAVGGQSLLIGNAEVSFPVYKELIRGAVFYDIGTVGADKYDIFKNTGDYKSGAGLGVRVRTPIGPVRLDYGYPLDDNHDDKRKGHFYFSVSHGF